MFLILVAINFIAGRVKQRVDLTAETSLHPVTRHQGDPREARYAGADPLLLHAECRGRCRLRSRLMRSGSRICSANTGRASKGKIEIQKLDPEPDSDAEDSARLDGVEPQPSRRRAIYLGLSVSLLDQKRRFRFSPRIASACSNTISRARSRAS